MGRSLLINKEKSKFIRGEKTTLQSKIKKTIKELLRVERPREKLMQYGPEKLSNSELLAIILRSGTKKESEDDLEMTKKISRGW
jgi:hypothetical protein